MDWREWSDEDRDEYEDALASAYGMTYDKSTVEQGRAFLGLLHDAEQAQRGWASALLEDYAIYGSRRDILRFARRGKRTAVIGTEGNKYIVSTSHGVAKKAAETGAQHWENLTFDQMLWPDLTALIDGWQTNLRSYARNIAAARKLLKLRDRFPDSTGPADATQQLGLTIEEYLATADAA